MAKQKNVKFGAVPSAGKSVRVAQDPESTDRQTVAWQLHRCDHEHGNWGWARLGPDGFRDIVGRLCQFESMTWGDLAKAAGGRSNGNNHHYVPVDNLCREAKRRLEELRLDDYDELFSLRLSGQERVYGIREGRVLRIIWYDPQHSVYPTNR